MFNGSGRSGDDAQDVAFLHDQQLFAVDRDFGARPFAEQDAVAGLDRGRSARPESLRAFAGGDDFALGGFSLALSGMIRPPLVFSSDWTRRTRTRSCSGLKAIVEHSGVSGCSVSVLSPVLVSAKWRTSRAVFVAVNGRDLRNLR